ncbi:MAG: hypothetical protein ABEJ42_08270 [Halobacteriaceae archaeon]
MRRLATTLSLLLVLAAVPAVGGLPEPAASGPSAQAPSPGAPLTQPHLLPAGPDAATGYPAPGVDLSNALDAQYGELSTRFRTHAARTAAAAVSGTARLDRYAAALAEIAAATRRLEARSRAVRGGLANGSISPPRAVARIGAITRAASVHRAALTDLEPVLQNETAGANPARVERLENRTEALEDRLRSLVGPVTTRLARGVTGYGFPGHVFVAATRGGVVLSVVDNGTYYREAIRPDNADDATTTRDLRAGRDLVATLYPTTWSASATGVRRIALAGDDDFRVLLDYPGGRLSARIDATTERVVREVHVINLSTYEPPAAKSKSKAGLVLTVNRTFAGGPLRVSLATADGEPVDGRVAIEGTEVGSTGEDGVFWTVSAGGRGDGRVIVSAASGGTRIPLTFSLTDAG